MKYKTLARILVKVIGVFFMGEGIIATVSTLQGLLAALGGTMSPGNWIAFIPIYGITGMAVGLYLFFGGKWVVNRIIPSNRPYCHECGYDLSHNASPQCPECGVAVPISPSR